MDFLDFIFLLLLASTFIQKLAESAYSKSNEKLLTRLGFAIRTVEKQEITFCMMQVGWFIASISEWYFEPFHLPVWIRVFAVFMFFITQTLRLWAVKSLGVHWSSVILAPEKIITPSLGPLTEQAMQSGTGAEVKKSLIENLFVEAGPYKYIRHPFYLAFIIEIAALPLCGNAIICALIFSIWNNYLLNKRIELEESWLFSRPGYHELFYHKSRFIPF